VRRRLLPALAAAAGALAEVALHFTVEAAGATGPTYRDFLRALAPDVRVRAVVEDETAASEFRRRLARWGVPEGRVRFVTTGYPITTWARDRFLVREGAGRGELLVPQWEARARPARANDWHAPFALARAAGLEARLAPLRFDGGDVVVGGGVAFVSASLLEKNVGVTAPTRGAALDALARELGRPVECLGRTRGEVPDHHMGMYLAPLAGGRVLVGSPDAALRAAPDAARRVAGADLSERAVRPFRRAAEILARRGYEVLELPLVPTTNPHAYVTYNNVILETHGGRRIVYLPRYGLAELDRAARRAWEAAGLRVRPVDVSRVWRRGGSLRCLVHVLRRR